MRGPVILEIFRPKMSKFILLGCNRQITILSKFALIIFKKSKNRLFYCFFCHNLHENALKLYRDKRWSCQWFLRLYVLLFQRYNVKKTWIKKKKKKKKRKKEKKKRSLQYLNSVWNRFEYVYTNNPGIWPVVLSWDSGDKNQCETLLASARARSRKSWFFYILACSIQWSIHACLSPNVDGDIAGSRQMQLFTIPTSRVYWLGGLHCVTWIVRSDLRVMGNQLYC